MVQAAACRDLSHEGNSYTVCEADPARDRIELFLRDEGGAVLGDFDAVEQVTDRPLAFAMNAGMYHEDRRPVGLHLTRKVREFAAKPPFAPQF